MNAVEKNIFSECISNKKRENMNFQEQKKYYESVAKEIAVVASLGTYFCSKKLFLSLFVGSLTAGLLIGPLDQFDDIQVTFKDVSTVYTHKAHNYVPDMGQLPTRHWSLVIFFCYQFVSELFKQATSTKNVRAFFTLTNFKVGSELEIPNETITKNIPKRCIILMHHRRHHHPGLTVSEFNDIVHVLSDDKFHIVAGRGWGRSKSVVSKVLGYLETKIYNAIDVAGCARTDSESCYQKLVDPFKTEDSMRLVIFPDKYGAQYFGDRAMFYRSGAFAAAMAAGVPIVDTLSMYPTYGTERHIFKVTSIIEPASWWPKPLEETETFLEYRKKYHKEIEYLRESMQRMFIQEIDELETQIGTCNASTHETGETEKVCKISF